MISDLNKHHHLASLLRPMHNFHTIVDPRHELHQGEMKQILRSVYKNTIYRGIALRINFS